MTMPMPEPAFTVDNPTPVVFAVDQESRTIKGLAVPFGDVAESGGRKWTFSRGSLTWGRVKVLDNHDWFKALGTATLTETDAGIEMTAKISRGPRGDEMLALAMVDPDTGEAVYDGLSIGLGAGVKATLRNGVQHATRALIREVSLTPLPAFSRAAITSVAASAALDNNSNKETPIMGENQTTEVEAVASFSATEGAALAATVTDLVKKVDGLADIKVPVAQTAQFAVTEEPIYRFSGTESAPSGFDFASDLLSAGRDGDQAALARVKTFTAERLSGPKFVATGDVNEVNPATYRPDMFLGQAPVPTSPLYDTFYKGGLASVQPFFWSKLDRAATTAGVGNHTEETEPTAGALVTAAGATVTPAPVSGKVHITREVGDQGGNPQVSGLVWNEFDRSFKIALETKTAALVAASAGSITALTGAIAAGANGAVAGLAIENGLIGLQFIPDGSRFVKAFGHVDLYTALASYENAEGEKRYPIINPGNRSGVSGAKYSFIDIAGYRMEPGHSLGATAATASNSYVVDPNAVHVWNSGLLRLDKLGEDVEGWDLGCFGYFAGAVYDVTGLRKIAYDPVA